MRWIAILPILWAPSVHSGTCRNVSLPIVKNERVLHVQPQLKQNAIRQQGNRRPQITERVVEKVVFRNAHQPLYPHAYGYEEPVFQGVYTHTSGDLQRRNLVARQIHQGDTARFERFARFFPAWKAFEKFEEHQQNTDASFLPEGNVASTSVERSIKAPALLESKCAKCHFTGKTASPGGEIYLDLPLDGPQLQSVIEAMKNGSMPKGGNQMTIEEQEAIAGYLAIQSLLQQQKDR